MWKEVALSSYYWSTLRSRRRAAADRAACEREPIQILFYHRVADDHPNGWTISTDSFARQVRWLRSRFDIVSLSEAQARITSGRNQRPTACITFDDGYADNRRFAIPLLLRYQIPFTYFVSTNHVLGGRSFPHDHAAGQPLAVNTPAHLREMVATGVEIGVHTRSHANIGGILSHDDIIEEIVTSKRELEAAIDSKVRVLRLPVWQARKPVGRGVSHCVRSRLRRGLFGLRRLQLSGRRCISLASLSRGWRVYSIQELVDD